MSTTRRQFIVDRCLGRGGFGEVYLATTTSPGGVDTTVAIKVLRRDVPPSSQAVHRLRDEAQLLARIQHPAILAVHDLLILAGRVCLVTEYVEGQDLDDCFLDPQGMPLSTLVEAVGVVAGALHTAFTAPQAGRGSPALGIVHRDIKPSNIRIGSTGEPKLLDFGIARTDAMTREARTGTDMMVGSPPYMAPERFLGNTVDPATDVYALGATLYQGITRERLVTVPVPVQASHAIDPGRYDTFLAERLDLLPPRVPAPLARLITEMLAFDPEMRPSAAEVSHRCDLLADEMPGPNLQFWARHRRWPAPGALVGELDGQVLYEGQGPMTTTELRAPIAAPQTFDLPTPASSSRITGVGLVLGGMSVTLVGAGGLVALLAIGVVVVSLWGTTPSPSLGAATRTPAAATPPPDPGREIPPAEIPTGDIPPAGGTAEEPPPEEIPPAGVTTEEPVQPTSRSPPDAPPIVRIPVPVVRPAAAPLRPRPRAAGFVSTSGDTPAILVRGDERILLPGSVPAGEWSVFVRWRDQDQAVNTKKRIVVTAGGNHTIQCTHKMALCSIDP